MTMALAAVIGQVLTLLGVLAGFAYQYIVAARQHRWDSEERQGIAAALKLRVEAAATELALTQVRAARAVADVQAATETRLHRAIDQNTSLSVKAFEAGAQAIEVGNHVNEKLYALGLAQQAARLEGTAERAQLQQTGDATLDLVTHIDDATSPPPRGGV